jgi:hypothetical protein
MDLLGRGYERIAMCAHPEGMHEHVPLKPGEDPPTTCFAAGCDCEPVVFVRADLHRGAVEALTEAVAAARTFNRGGMTWLEYDAALVRFERIANGGQ